MKQNLKCCRAFSEQKLCVFQIEIMIHLCFILSILLFKVSDRGIDTAQVTLTCGEDGQIEIPSSTSSTAAGKLPFSPFFRKAKQR